MSTLTSLDNFTQDEVRKIQLALELDSSYLDRGSYLYERLSRLETRDSSQDIKSRANCVKDLANKINSALKSIDSGYLDEEFGVDSLSETVKDEVKRAVTYRGSLGNLTGLIRYKESLQARLRRELSWEDQFKICLG